MAGLSEIVQDMRPKCSHCHKAIDLSEFANEMFQRILKTIATGDRVFVAHFGTFTAKYVAGRVIQSFGTEKQIAGRNVIRFRAAAHAKRVINEKFNLDGGDDDDSDPEPEPETEEENETGSDDGSNGGAALIEAADRIISRAARKLREDLSADENRSERVASSDSETSAVKFANPTRRKKRRVRAAE